MKAIVNADSVDIDYGEKNPLVLIEIGGKKVPILEGKSAQVAIEVLREELSKRGALRVINGGSRVRIVDQSEKLWNIADIIAGYAGMSPFIAAPQLLRELLQG